jgi:lysyl-tRNA synthetase class 1
MPHLDIVEELTKRNGSPLTDLERRHLDSRIRAAKYWLANYATDEEKIVVHERLPERASQLSSAQAYFLQILSEALTEEPWEEEALQMAVFNAARLTPIDQASAFKAIYRVLLDRENGPKAGNLLSFLERQFVVGRFSDIPVDVFSFWRESATSAEVFETWLALEKDNISKITAELVFASLRMDLPQNPLGRHLEAGVGVIEFLLIMTDGKTICKRVLFEEFKSLDTSFNEELAHFEVYARDWIKEIEAASNLAISTGVQRATNGSSKAEFAQARHRLI